MVPLNNENWIYPWLVGGYNVWPVIGQKESNFQTPAEMRKKKMPLTKHTQDFFPLISSSSSHIFFTLDQFKNVHQSLSRSSCS
jgi:hypothetical protein